MAWGAPTEPSSRARTSNRDASPGRRDEAAHTQHEHRQGDERVKRGGGPVDPVAQTAEALEPTQCSFDDVALRLQHGVLGVQLAFRLLDWNAPPRRDERRESMFTHKLPEAQTGVALVG